ncbi:TlpA family protein disulfide reductase [Orrella marina]|uniref:Thioredoxin n=1 Tax=Orrella marina TaxID=2163011 RepID=A0A2R4XMX6_9BURK|nr:TlpA disulfide reductase family protein [Orrella marina]AWB35160.1 thioredoxin [Orrella marina]
MKRRTLIVGAAGLAALGATGWFAFKESARKAPQANREARRTPVEPDPAVFFKAAFDELNGDVVQMESLRGQPLVINFWATWCPPCVKEMPELDRISEEMPNARVIGVAIDSRDNVVKFLDKVPVKFPIYIAGHAGIEVTRGLGNNVMALPFTILINDRGELVSKVLGEVDPASLRTDISRMLAG